MTFVGSMAAAAFVIAVLAYLSARRTARQLAQMTDLYWRLKYDHGELKAQIAPTPAAPAPPSGAFVPLSQVRRSDPAP